MNTLDVHRLRPSALGTPSSTTVEFPSLNREEENEYLNPDGGTPVVNLK